MAQYQINVDSQLLHQHVSHDPKIFQKCVRIRAQTDESLPNVIRLHLARYQVAHDFTGFFPIYHSRGYSDDLIIRLQTFVIIKTGKLTTSLYTWNRCNKRPD